MCQKYNVWELILQRKLSLAFVAFVYSNFTTLLLNEHHCFSNCPNNFYWLPISRSEHKIIKKEEIKKNKNPHNYNEKLVLGITAPVKFPIFITIWFQEWIRVVPFSVLVTIIVITGNEPNCSALGILSLAIVWGPALTFCYSRVTRRHSCDQRIWSTWEMKGHPGLSGCIV